MKHGIRNDFLCTACKLDVVFKDDLGKSKINNGTAFFVHNAKSELCLITNRHMIDLDYN